MVDPDLLHFLLEIPTAREELKSYRDKNGANILIGVIASDIGQRDKVTLATAILKRDLVNLDDADDKKQTALHKAVLYGLTDTVRELISLGADPGLQDNDGCTPLMLTMDWRDLSEVKNRSRKTEVALATELGKTKGNLNWNVKDKEGDTVLHIATHFDRTDLFQLYFKHHMPGDQDVLLIKDQAKHIPIEVAAGCGSRRVLKFLIRAGRCKGMEGIAAAHQAAAKFHASSLKMILADGVAKNASTPFKGATLLTRLMSHLPIWTSQYKSFMSILQIVLNWGADPNFRCKCGKTVMHTLVYRYTSVK